MHEASQGTFSRVFDLEVKDLQGKDAETRTSPFESRFPINIGITGHVATTGEVWKSPCQAATPKAFLILKNLGPIDHKMET